MDWLFYENEEKNRGHNIICGIDEAGRGPLAGPVVSAAVILPDNTIIDGADDSKKLTAQKREKLFSVITESALSYGIGIVDEKTIDEINILNATFLSMKRAVDKLNMRPDVVLVDGNRTPDFCGIESRTIVKGDSKSMSIACASILAKVVRDRIMMEISNIYPVYQFEKHKGYGTSLHCDLLREYGPCDIHRKTFLKKILASN